MRQKIAIKSTSTLSPQYCTGPAIMLWPKQGLEVLSMNSQAYTGAPSSFSNRNPKFVSH